MRKVGIAVGHFGPGTGAVHEQHDEWTLAHADACAIALQLHDEGKLCPVLLAIDRTAHPWDLIRRANRLNLFADLGDINVRYEWAVREEVDVLVELHYNSALTGRPAGHEVWVRTLPGPKTKRLGALMIDALDARLTNPGRGLRQKSYRTLFRLHAADVPAVIIEPAFIWEECVVQPEWQASYRRAVVSALYSFFSEEVV